MMGDIKLCLIAAMCNGRGIGKNGDLPWKLKKEFAYFQRITKQTSIEGKQNVVIMGRKTWDSIPVKMRPLPQRTNLVISRTWEEPAEGALAVKSFDEALQLIRSKPLADTVENVYVIGGSAIYQMALESSFCHRIYLTYINADFECDTFFPDFDVKLFQEIKLAEVDSELQEEDGITYKYCVYEKIINK